jgi:hypothetical protein
LNKAIVNLYNQLILFSYNPPRLIPAQAAIKEKQAAKEAKKTTKKTK